MPVSSFGQTTQPVRPLNAQAPTIVVQGTPLGLEDAVRMALENNLGIQVEKLNPQIQLLGIRRADAAYAPTLFSTFSRRSSTAPPGDFLSAGGASNIVTNSNFSTSGGVQSAESLPAELWLLSRDDEIRPHQPALVVVFCGACEGRAERSPLSRPTDPLPQSSPR